MKRILATALVLVLLVSAAYAEGGNLGTAGAAGEAKTAGQVQQAVRELQLRLMELGYLTGEADGIYGSATAGAMGKFQQDHGLDVTGLMDAATQEALMAAAIVPEADEEEPEDLPLDVALTPTPVPAEDAEPEEDLVTRAQKRLIELGFLSGKADGIAGEQTLQALRLFQSANGLPVTGSVDEATLTMLFSDRAKGDVVRQAQQRLIDLGYLSGKADGLWGAKSAAALRLFQKLHDLPVTGEMDDASWDRLFGEDVKALRPALAAGDKGDGVQALQQRLIELGFLTGKADGSYGKKTSAAVLAFQQHLLSQGLDYEGEITASGEATSLTQEYLFNENYSSYIKDILPGAEDGEVLRLERRLNALGYLDAEADESYDEYAARAMTAFQQKAGLTADGSADQAAQNALFASDAPRADRWTSHDVALGDACGVVKDVQGALIRLGFLTGLDDGEYGSGLEKALEVFYNYLTARDSDAAALFAARETLSAQAQDALLDGSLAGYAEDVTSGADKLETARVQTRLSTLFYLSDSGVDGLFGSATRSAIEQFQTANGLRATGVADAATQEILFSDDAIGNWTKYKLEISIDDQRVYVYELDENSRYQQIDEFICSTGLGNSTPKGVFTSTRPLNRWHYFTKFQCWAQYSYQIEGDILFHSVLYSEQDVNTLRTGSVYALGSKASHGCVRLKVADAKWIYENCAKGTIVVVY